MAVGGASGRRFMDAPGVYSDTGRAGGAGETGLHHIKRLRRRTGMMAALAETWFR